MTLSHRPAWSSPRPLSIQPGVTSAHVPVVSRCVLTSSCHHGPRADRCRHNSGRYRTGSFRSAGICRGRHQRYGPQSSHSTHSSPPGNGDSSVVQWYSAGLVIETSRVRVQAGALGNFLLRSQVSVLTLISVSVPPPYDRSCT